MPHLVVLLVGPGRPVRQHDTMRIWLDHQNFEPDAFRDGRVIAEPAAETRVTL